MDEIENLLSRNLILYQIIYEEIRTKATLHIQIYPGEGDYSEYKLLRETWRQQKTIEFQFTDQKRLASLSIEEGDIIFIRTTNNEIATAGGIWQIQWQNDRAYDGLHGYIFTEIAASGIEMVEVKELLQEEDFTLFADAVACAQTLLKEQKGISAMTLVNAREFGNAAPEHIHKTIPLPFDLRAIEHTWFIVISGYKGSFSRATFFLIEVHYHLQDQTWFFSAHIVEEHDPTSIL